MMKCHTPEYTAELSFYQITCSVFTLSTTWFTIHIQGQVRIPAKSFYILYFIFYCFLVSILYIIFFSMFIA